MSTTDSRGTGAKSAVKAFGAVVVFGIVLMVVGVVLKYAFDIFTPFGVVAGWVTFIGLVGAGVSGIVLLVTMLVTSETPAESPTTTSPSGLAPGWYPDQTDPNLRRYYDGRTWTSGTAPRE